VKLEQNQKREIENYLKRYASQFFDIDFNDRFSKDFWIDWHIDFNKSWARITIPLEGIQGWHCAIEFKPQFEASK
jgi:hypothetical protein